MREGLYSKQFVHEMHLFLIASLSQVVMDYMTLPNAIWHNGMLSEVLE